MSGQIACDANHNIAEADDVGMQLRKSLDSLSAALASAGATLDEVGALILFIRDSHMGQGD
ncbi:MAG: Rid family hydrolase [Pseudomonadota bacterium]